ncbi:MAG: hypothetical protein H0W40_16265 [Methylibium sp.]|uniref:hypothetical protein n=1 Tax=Methylibium sp. TaxID=2067992 RepID=UPI00183CF064|nr:hypothetical protein [Methylibium sp.]MBA3598910.1 hypothetical protein [Methylibium sp.]
MNRINILAGAALVAGSFVGSSALAADQTTNQTSTDKADKTQVVPAREDLKPGAAPTVERMDDNAQRQHDRDRGSAGAGSGTGTDAAAGTGAAAGADAGVGGATAPAAAGGGAGAEASAGGSNAAADSSARGGGMATAGGGETRDWAAVDTNGDNLISPEEMEEALKATGPQAGQKR